MELLRNCLLVNMNAVCTSGNGPQGFLLVLQVAFMSFLLLFQSNLFWLYTGCLSVPENKMFFPLLVCARGSERLIKEKSFLLHSLKNKTMVGILVLDRKYVKLFLF